MCLDPWGRKNACLMPLTSCPPLRLYRVLRDSEIRNSMVGTLPRCATIATTTNNFGAWGGARAPTNREELQIVRRYWGRSYRIVAVSDIYHL